MAEVIHLDSLEWKLVRPDIAHGVHGKTLLDGSVKVVQTRVEPGGTFSPHRDSYGHLLYLLSGTGIVGIGRKTFDVRAGHVVQISPGDEHFYRNSGSDDLILISLNISGM